MKTRNLIKTATLLLTYGALANSAQAAGYRCQAQCIVAESSEYQVHLLGSVRETIGTDYARSADDVFDAMQTMCENRANRAELRETGVLVNRISFTQSRVTEAERTSSWQNWSNSDSGANSQAFAYRRGRTRIAGAQSVSWSSNDSWSSGSVTNYSSDARDLSVDIDFANPQQNCVSDANIPSDEPPTYTGNGRALP